MLSKPLAPPGEYPLTPSAAFLPEPSYAPQLGDPNGSALPCIPYWGCAYPPKGPEKKSPDVLESAASSDGEARLLAAAFRAARGCPFSTAFTCACKIRVAYNFGLAMQVAIIFLCVKYNARAYMC